jgi:hypothetical protein
MNGQRKQPKPTAKQALERLAVLEYQNAMLKLDIRQRTIALLDNLWTYESIMEQILDQCGTINEARRWFADFKTVLNDLDMADINHQSKLRDKMAGIGIYLDGLPNHGDFVDELWGDK